MFPLGLPVSAVLNPTVPPADAKNRTCNCQNATVTHLYLMKLNGTQMEVLPLNWEILNPFNAVNLSTFTAPDHEFLVMITGRDEHGYKFQRTTSTIVPGQAGLFSVSSQSVIQSDPVWHVQSLLLPYIHRLKRYGPLGGNLLNFCVGTEVLCL